MIRHLIHSLRLQYLPVLALLSVLLTSLALSCSEYDTNSIGSNFLPVNSQVRSFTHLVYVEYTSDGARVWGPYKDQVDVQIDDKTVRLQNTADSLVIIAYGYPSKYGSDMHESLTITSSRPYALYLSGLYLNSLHGPALSCLGQGNCYIVLPEKSQNELNAFQFSDTSDGCIYAEGQLIFGGTGKLLVRNHAQLESSGVTHAISAAGLLCQYKVNVTLESLSGDGIHVRKSMRNSLGVWDITALRHGISAGDSIVLFDGTFTGSAAEGAFLLTDAGTALRMPKVTVASAWASDIMDSLATTALFDSVQAVWQEQFFDFVIEADSTYLLKDTLGAKVATLKFSQSVPSPYVLISDGKTKSDAELQIELSH